MTAENPVGNIKLNEVKFEEKGGQSDTNLQSIFQLAGGGGKFGEATAEIKAKNNGQDDFFLALTGIMYSGNELLPTKAAAMMEQEAKRILTDKGIIGKGENVNSEALQVLAFQYLKIVDITDPQTSLLGRSRELVKEAILTAEESKLLKLNEAINAYNLAFLVKKSKKSRAKLEGDKVVISSRKIVELNGDSSQDQISALRTLLELGNLVDKSGQDTPIVQFKTSLVLNLPKDQEEITIHGVEFNKGLWIGDQTEAKVNGVTGNVIVRNLAQVEINSVEGKAWVQDSAQIEIGDGCENLIIEAVNTKFKGLVVYKGQVYTPVALEGLAESFQLIKDGELQKIRDTVKQVPLAKEPVSAGGSLESGNAYKLEKDGQQTMIISMGDNKWRVLEKGKDAREIDDAGLVDFGLRVKVDEAGETILEQQQLSIRDEEITLFSKKNELLGTKWLLDIDSLFYFAENYEDLGLVNRDGQAGLMKQLTVLLESKKIKSSEVAVAFEKDIGVSIYLTLDQIVQGLNQIDFQGFVFEMCETVINNKQFEVKTGVKNEGQGMNKKIVSKDTKTQLLENSGDNQEMWEQLYVGFEDNKFVGLVNSNDAWIIHNARQGKGEEEYKVLQKRVMSDLANYRYTKDIEARLRLLLPEKTAWYAIDERVEIAYDRTVSIDEKQWQPIRIRMKNERRRSLEDLQALLLTVNQDAPKMIEYDITFPNIDGRIRNDLVEIAARPERSLASDDPFGYPLELRIINFHSMIIEVMKELYQDAEAKKFNQAINAFNQNFPVEEGQAPRAKLEDGQVVISGKEKIRLNDQSPKAQISAVRDVCALGKLALFENSVGFYLPEG
ncbi:MAG: hypothetical protein U0946_04390, partial [Patescibacteria group bacterium]|nr:hypothetical protein [Patescibacteria group bacterium]